MLGSSEVSVSAQTVDSLIISAPLSGTNATQGVVSEKEIVSRPSNDRDVLSNGDKEAHAQPIANVESGNYRETPAYRSSYKTSGCLQRLSGNYSLIQFCYTS